MTNASKEFGAILRPKWSDLEGKWHNQKASNLKETQLAHLQFLTYFTMDLFVFEVLGEAAGDAFSECIPDLLLEAILQVIFGRLSRF